MHKIFASVFSFKPILLLDYSAYCSASGGQIEEKFEIC